MTQDPRKVPFLFEHLLTEVADPRHEQAKVMFLIASEQYKVQHKNMTAASRAQEGKRIHSKFFDPRTCASSIIYFLGERTLILKKSGILLARSAYACVCAGSQFDVSADVTPEVLEVLKAQCSPSPSSSSSSSSSSDSEGRGGSTEPSPEVFDAARLLIEEDILRGR